MSKRSSEYSPKISKKLWTCKMSACSLSRYVRTPFTCTLYVFDQRVDAPTSFGIIRYHWLIGILGSHTPLHLHPASTDISCGQNSNSSTNCQRLSSIKSFIGSFSASPSPTLSSLLTTQYNSSSVLYIWYRKLRTFPVDWPKWSGTFEFIFSILSPLSWA